jgi:hypothetical protein
MTSYASSPAPRSSSSKSSSSYVSPTHPVYEDPLLATDLFPLPHDVSTTARAVTPLVKATHNDEIHDTLLKNEEPLIKHADILTNNNKPSTTASINNDIAEDKGGADIDVTGSLLLTSKSELSLLPTTSPTSGKIVKVGSIDLDKSDDIEALDIMNDFDNCHSSEVNKELERLWSSLDVSEVKVKKKNNL